MDTEHSTSRCFSPYFCFSSCSCSFSFSLVLLDNPPTSSLCSPSCLTTVDFFAGGSSVSCRTSRLHLFRMKGMLCSFFKNGSLPDVKRDWDHCLEFTVRSHGSACRMSTQRTPKLPTFNTWPSSCKSWRKKRKEKIRSGTHARKLENPKQ